MSILHEENVSWTENGSSDLPQEQRDPVHLVQACAIPQDYLPSSFFFFNIKKSPPVLILSYCQMVFSVFYHLERKH